MLFKDLTTLDQFPETFSDAYHGDEDKYVRQCLKAAALPDATNEKIAAIARELVIEIREQRTKKSGLDAFLYEYDLSSEEGIALMCLAEAMLRVPDSGTADDLIRDKITSADWQANIGKSDSFFVNASTWALMLTGKVVSEPKKKSLGGIFKGLIRRSGEPVIRAAVGQAMKVLGKQFVMGRSIEEALKRAKDYEKKGYTFSYDMLGEAARTDADARRYFDSYADAIEKIGKASKDVGVHQGSGISIKLSALHPRYQYAKRETVITELSERLLQLAQLAKAKNIGLTIDAEEAYVLTLSLEIFERVYCDASLQGWEGLGLVVQAYQKRAPAVLDWLTALYQKQKKRIMLRLVKGAYWDTEIKLAQVEGLSGYPVYTRKNATDVSYIACLRKILDNSDVFYGQFGSHNAYTVASVLTLASEQHDYEFQCLHGMGTALYDMVTEKHNVPCRIYAPVGTHKDLLAYLVRRLLENGANTSFVNRIADNAAPLDEIIKDPLAYMQAQDEMPHPKIPLPRDLYGIDRLNAKGIDLTDAPTVKKLAKEMAGAASKKWEAAPLIDGKSYNGEKVSIKSPTDHHQTVGHVSETDTKQIDTALTTAAKAQVDWSKVAVNERADCLRKAADLLEERMPTLMAIAVKEAGKTVLDAVAEVREAIDFCRYYANQAETTFATEVMPGPTGEYNALSYHGRGVILCISPWNFPLAIFMGQVVAALVAGNAVIAKPAEQTPLIAMQAVKLLHDAGIPKAVLNLLPGNGETIGARLVNDARIAGVMFTGSTETARSINQTLAARPGAIVPLIAETGGLNTMIVDSSALLEQVVLDVINSAFGSAGQRCSALRVVYVQDDVADDFITMLQGAMAKITIGDPQWLATDVGPVIDQDALNILQTHFHKMQQQAKLIYQVELPEACQHGTFFAPCAFEIEKLQQLSREVFGPFLHLIRFKANKLNKVLSDINDSGYGLTQGLHSRISARSDYLQDNLAVGNLYVNRNMIGAVVGVQPFGGEGLSGTGPKAGGPHYLARLALERCITVDTTASGGNASLLTLEE